MTSEDTESQEPRPMEQDSADADANNDPVSGIEDARIDESSPVFDDGSSEEPLPEIEDGSVDEPAVESEILEDDPELLDSSARSIEAGSIDESETAGIDLTDVEQHALAELDKDDTSDTEDTVDADSVSDEAVAPAVPVALDRETSARPLIVELKHIESEVRKLLDGRDPKRKRKLGGSRRWLELEEDIISWRYSHRIDEPTLGQLQQLVRRRNHLFNHLSFIAGTRPTWNS